MATTRTLKRDIECLRELIRRDYVEMEADITSAERRAIAEDIDLKEKELTKLKAKLAILTSLTK